MADSNQIVHFPVGNGDMTLIQVGPKGSGGKTILIDLKINGGDEPDKCDALKELHSHLPKNSRGIPYLDLLVITHPDDDHVAGYDKHFYSGDPEDYKFLDDGEFDLIIANEIWFSEVCTRRVSKDRRLGDAAQALRTELKRRRQLFEDNYRQSVDGNRLMTVGEFKHEDDKTERWDLPGMVIKRGTRKNVGQAEALILGPFGEEIFDEVHQSSKNDSSIIIRWMVNGSRVLTGGDATAWIWKHVDQSYPVDYLEYDLLIAPHHCSWRTLSLDSSSQCESPKILDEAKKALSHSNFGAYVISSSKKIKASEADPPSSRAKKEYMKMINNSDNFICLADSGSETKQPVVRKFNLLNAGVIPISIGSAQASVIPNESTPIRHG